MLFLIIFVIELSVLNFTYNIHVRAIIYNTQCSFLTLCAPRLFQSNEIATRDDFAHK